LRRGVFEGGLRLERTEGARSDTFATIFRFANTDPLKRLAKALCVGGIMYLAQTLEHEQPRFIEQDF
jgi:hypothetical protein